MRLRDDSGSAVAEFVMVSGLLLLLALGLVQLALALHVRNTVIDAAAEGARFGSLADRTPADGAARASELITTAIGASYAQDVSVATTTFLGRPALVVTVRAPLPVVGLLGPEAMLEVDGHAALEIVAR
jgi:Flp pilus assembly protein TadG